MAPTTTRKRSYDSTRRRRQAAQTRADVLAAATKLFGEQGWAATTLAAIADAAGVSVETIYNGFGSKKGLLSAAMDVAVAGDDEPIALVDRPEFAAFAAGALDERVARGIAYVTEIHVRSAGVWNAVTEAAQADPEIEAWRQERERGRHLDVGRAAALILGHPVEEPLVTMLWLLYGAESYRKLVTDAGLSLDEYRAFVADATYRLAAPELGSAPSGPPRG